MQNLTGFWTTETAFHGIAALVRASLEGIVLVLAVYAVCRFVKRLPVAVRCLLWWFVCLKMLIDLAGVPPVPLPLLPPERPLSGVRISVPADSVSVVETMSDATSPTMDRTPIREGQDPAAGALAILAELYLTGVAVMIVVGTAQWILLQRTLRTARPLKRCDIIEEVERLARMLGLKRAPTLQVSPTGIGPLVVGVRHPLLVLPEAEGEHLSVAELRGILAHELAHVRRNDLQLGIVPILARTLFFFHPLVWLACREYDLARETACDDAALRITGVPVDDYGRLLLRLSAPETAGNPCPALALGVASDYQLLLRRLEGLQSLTQISPRSRRFSLGILALAICGLIPVQVIARQEAAPPPVPTVHPPVLRKEREAVTVLPVWPRKESKSGRTLSVRPVRRVTAPHALPSSAHAPKKPGPPALRGMNGVPGAPGGLPVIKAPKGGIPKGVKAGVRPSPITLSPEEREGNAKREAEARERNTKKAGAPKGIEVSPADFPKGAPQSEGSSLPAPVEETAPNTTPPAGENNTSPVSPTPVGPPSAPAAGSATAGPVLNAESTAPARFIYEETHRDARNESQRDRRGVLWPVIIDAHDMPHNFEAAKIKNVNPPLGAWRKVAIFKDEKGYLTPVMFSHPLYSLSGAVKVTESVYTAVSLRISDQQHGVVTEAK